MNDTIKTGFAQSKPSIIRSNTRIEGKVITNSDIKIQGVIIGDVSAKSILLDHDALCTGSFSSDISIISGQFDGIITARQVKIKSSAEITGQIKQNSIEVAAGAKINAKIQNMAPSK